MVRHGNALHLCASNAHACGDHRTAAISILVDMHDEELRDVVQSRLLCGMLTATRFACETMNTRHLQRGLDGVLSVAAASQDAEIGCMHAANMLQQYSRTLLPATVAA